MKNIILLLRSLSNVLAFGLLGYGLAVGAWLHASLGVVAVLLCIYCNLIRPITGRKRG